MLSPSSRKLGRSSTRGRGSRKEEHQQQQRGDGNSHRHKKAAARFREICIALFDVSPGTALRAGENSTSSRVGSESNSLKESRPSTSNRSIVEFREAETIISQRESLQGDGYDQLNFFQVHKANSRSFSSRSLTPSSPSRGSKLLKAFKRNASNLSNSSTTCTSFSADASSFFDDGSNGRSSTESKDIEWYSAEASVDWDQHEAESLSKGLQQQEKGEKEKLTEEVDSLQSATDTSTFQSGGAQDNNVSRTDSALSDSSQSCLDFSVSPTGMLQFEGQLRTKFTTTLSLRDNQSHQDDVDSFLLNLSAAATAAPRNGEAGVGQLLDEDDSTEASQLTTEEITEKYCDNDADLNLHDVVLWNGRDSLYVDTNSAEVEPMENSRSPPKSSSSPERNLILPPSLPIVATHSDSSLVVATTEKPLKRISFSKVVSDPTEYGSPLPWSPRSANAVDLEKVVSEKHLALEIRCRELEKKLSKAMPSHDVGGAELATKVSTPHSATRGHSLTWSSKHSPPPPPLLLPPQKVHSDYPSVIPLIERRRRRSEVIDSTSGHASSVVNVNSRRTSVGHLKETISYGSTGYGLVNGHDIHSYDRSNHDRVSADKIDTYDNSSFGLVSGSNINNYDGTSIGLASSPKTHINDGRGHGIAGDAKIQHFVSLRQSSPKHSRGFAHTDSSGPQLEEKQFTSASGRNPRSPKHWRFTSTPPRGLSHSNTSESTFEEWSKSSCTSSSGWQSSVRRVALSPEEEADLEEEVRQCLEHSRRLLGNMSPVSGSRGEGTDIRKGRSVRRSSRESACSVLALSRQRRNTLDKNIPESVAEVEHRQLENGNDQCTSLSENKQVEQVLEEDYSTISPRRLRKAMVSWDRKRSELESSKNQLSIGPQTPQSRRSRFYLEATGLSPTSVSS